jgi:N-acetyl-anhydromuramyl-L-alanine amidase AmpD
MSERAMPVVRVRRATSNMSSRNGVKPQLIVLHSTEGSNVTGLGDLTGLGSWFATKSAQVSSHVATDAEGNSARFVADENKAWHCARYNSLSLGIEQVGRASQASWAEPQQRETARWMAYWSRRYGIPLQKGAVANGVVTRPGVVRHSELGPLGGGHSDPGTAYPLHEVLSFAHHYRTLQSS